MSERLPSARVLRRLLKYDAKTSKLFWRARSPWMFRGSLSKRKEVCATWNTRFAGKEAFCIDGGRGYFVGRLFGRNHLTHRVIWCHVYGDWPDGPLDHIDGNTWNNSIENLRRVTPAENSKNQRLAKDNKSGHHGVRWHPRTNSWLVRIGLNGGTQHIGYFSNFEDAVTARKAAERKLGYHPNHGRVA